MYDTGDYSVSDFAEVFSISRRPSIEPLPDNWMNNLFPSLHS